MSHTTYPNKPLTAMPIAATAIGYGHFNSTMIQRFAMMIPDDAANQAPQAKASFNPSIHGLLTTTGVTEAEVDGSSVGTAVQPARTAAIVVS
mmetsp:Transcript_38916/g.86569  ORF Transcript_38916/g.86569 Transcript_38916/m.86569 type:complete len:92 (-) Transcript_38916:134-409(-)